MMRAKKSLGQHFLRSERALASIIDAGDVSAEDVVLEIGPGEGILTKRLLFFAAKVVAVEKDNFLYEQLKAQFASEIEAGKLDLIHGDILDFDPNMLGFYKGFTYKLIANIPYNITGQIIRKFLSADYQPEAMVLLVQKEVAERIVAKNKAKKMWTPSVHRGKESILSISVKAYGKPRYVETVKAGSFAPAPKVDSAILAVEDISKSFFNGFSEEVFFKVVRAGFGSKRKKLSSNLSAIYPKDKIKAAFYSLGLDENIRAEDISIEEWRILIKSLTPED